MKALAATLLMSSVWFGGVSILAAQDKPEMMPSPPPKILNVIREYTKPGKSGMSHEKTESAFVQAMRAAKWPTHYLAVDSLSGKPRTLFFTAYDSFAAMEKDMRAAEKNPSLMAALDRAGVADGELLSDTDASDLVYREDLSLHAPVDIPHMRYFEISLFHIKPGHDKEWEALVKMYQSGYERMSDVHWACYEAVYGQLDGTFVVFVPMKSASEIDHGMMEDKQFEDALGGEGMKKFRELEAAAVDSSQTNLFAFNPRMSYVGDDWIKADPDFWKPKPAHSEAKKTEEKSEAKH